MFAGGSMPSEIRELLPRWGMVVRTFVAAIDSMTMGFSHLPCEGGMLDQPIKTMEAWELLRRVYSESQKSHGKDHIRGH